MKLSEKLFMALVKAEDPAVTELDIGAIDCEVFERLIMRILTSLRRLYHKISFELDSIESGRQGGGSRDGRCGNDQRCYMWTLTRRVTRRNEKLRSLLDVLLQKKDLSIAREAMPGKKTPISEVYLLEALYGKVEKSIAEYEGLESVVMKQLCSV